MKLNRITMLMVGAALAAPVASQANADLASKIKDPKNWAAQAGDFANHRYSELAQVNTKNVKDLQVAWTFSTGVLRGHEGSPLVIGDMMYILRREFCMGHPYLSFLY